MADRNEILKAIGANIRTWTVTDDEITVDGPDDQENFQRMLDRNPEVNQAYIERMRGRKSNQPAQSDEVTLRIREMSERIATLTAPAQPTANSPLNPTRMSDALAQYRATKTGEEHAERTSIERDRLLRRLVAETVIANPELEADPYVHQLATHHLSAFLDKTKRKRATDGGDTEDAASPRTQMKKLGALRVFFDWARDEAEATTINPAAALGKREKALRKAASKAEEHYDPFENKHLAKMFRPKAYLEHNNRADFFWAPLLGLYIGARLGEIVTLALADIGRHAETGIWYLDVKPERAKNKNSVRRLPVPARLMDLGFIEYVEHLQKLGATLLFPHYDFSIPTMRRMPSKNCTRRFASYLDKLELCDPKLVFHSFRHTVVSALQDSNTPLADAMQITGHLAQEHAIKTGRMSVAQAQSVHLETYTHSDKARLNVAYPLARLKEHLERSIVVALDFDQLRAAASIVKEHMVKTPTGFASGWHTNKHLYAGKQLERLK